MLSRKFILIILVFVNSISFGQKIIINGQETDRLLKWADFTGRVDKQSPYFAFTYWNVFTRYDAFQFKGDTAKWNVIVTVEFGKNSWQKPDKVTDGLLKHEQGHFDIGILCGIELNQRIKNTVFLRHNYQSKLEALTKEVIDKYIQLDKQYDNETEHFHNQEQQSKWDSMFQQKIRTK